MYEYLSHNFGLYFVSDPVNDFGSRDLKALVDRFERDNCENRLKYVTADRDPGTEGYKERLHKNRREASHTNYLALERYVVIMVYIRRLIFVAINKQLEKRGEKTLTPYEWLLVQLFPKQAWGQDLFQNTLKAALRYTQECRGDFSARNAIEEHGDTGLGLYPDCKKWDSQLMVVDEVQVLLKELPDLFLSDILIEKRTAFFAVLKAMSKIPDLLSSETWLPLVAIREASASIMAKWPNTLLENRRTVFRVFQPLNIKKVEIYMIKTEPNEVQNSSVMDHICRWLRGCPKWAASFLELYFVQEKKSSHTGTRGSFSHEGALLVQGLELYIYNYTLEKPG